MPFWLPIPEMHGISCIAQFNRIVFALCYFLFSWFSVFQIFVDFTKHQTCHLTVTDTNYVKYGQCSKTYCPQLNLDSGYVKAINFQFWCLHIIFWVTVGVLLVEIRHSHIQNILISKSPATCRNATLICTNVYLLCFCLFDLVFFSSETRSIRTHIEHFQLSINLIGCELQYAL